MEGNGSIGATAATPMLTRRNGVDTAVSKPSLSNEREAVKQKNIRYEYYLRHEPFRGHDERDAVSAAREGERKARDERKRARHAGYARRAGAEIFL